MQENLKLIIVTTVWHRHFIYQLFQNGIERLIPHAKKKNVDIEVVVVGSNGDGVNKILPKTPEWHYREYPDTQLGKKLNHGFLEAELLSPDYVLLLDSDDVMSNKLFDSYYELMKEGCDYMGCLDMYEYDLLGNRLLYWAGHVGDRKGEFLRTGRCFARRVLEYLEWKPVPDHKQDGVGLSITEKLSKLDPFLDKVPIVLKDGDVMLCGLKGWYSLSSNDPRKDRIEVDLSILDNHMSFSEIVNMASYKSDDIEPNE